MNPSLRISSLLALAAMAVAVQPPGASAQTVALPAPYVKEPIGFGSLPSIGNGTIAWVDYQTPEHSNSIVTTVWTLRDGAPALVATLPRVEKSLEAGTDEHGKPVVVVGDDGTTKHGAAFHLVHLDSGDVRRLALGHGGRLVTDVAIDAGRVLYATTSPRRDAYRGRSVLWTARLKGSALAKPTRLRRSPRGDTYTTVRADRGLIAVTGYRDLRKPDEGNCYALLPLFVGTAHGVWRKTVDGCESDGGLFRLEAAGFSRNGRSVIETNTDSDYVIQDLRAWSVSLRTGRSRTLKLQEGHMNAGEPEFGTAAYDPGSDRLLVSSLRDEDPGSGNVVGWSSVLG